MINVTNYSVYDIVLLWGRLTCTCMFRQTRFHLYMYNDVEAATTRYRVLPASVVTHITELPVRYT